MKKLLLVLSLAVLLAGGAVAYVYRSDIRDWWSSANAETLPAAKRFVPPISTPKTSDSEPSVVEGGAATSAHYVLISSPPTTPSPVKIDPFAKNGTLPATANLDVPFTTQSPYSKWTAQDEESCEEAAAFMVDAFYRGQSGVIPPAQAQKTIDTIVAYEMKTFGFFKDTNAADTVRFIKGVFGYQDVIIRPYDVTEMKWAIANGYPVLLPTSGRLLNNPNFKNGGPPYHMIVAKGYTKDLLITNDPGTRKGKDYTYAFDTIANAAHDWNGGDVLNGKPLMIVVLPNPS